MTELINVREENGQQLVSARELHEFLKVKTRFNDWINGRIKKYDFIENIDYIAITEKKVTAQGNESEYKDFAITLDMAKELSMVENSDKGSQARKYFIQCEKKLKGFTPQLDYKKAVEDTRAELGLISDVADMLHLNDNSKLQLITKSFKNHGIDTNILPEYTDSNGVLKSITDLLKDNKINMSPQKFNKILIEKGILKENERKSSTSKSGVKKFKTLVKEYYGENQVSPKNPKETQPMYYVDKFKELLEFVGVA